MNFSTLNHTEELFTNLGKCDKIKIKEIEEGFDPVTSFDIFVEDILNKALELDNATNVHIHCFIEGHPKKREETNFDDQWNKKKTSFKEKIFGFNTAIRITNVQKTNLIIGDICNQLSNRFRMPATCNMYLSPNDSYNCLGKHSDPQETFIFQLLGKKNWKIFTKNQDEDLRLLNSKAINGPQKEFRSICLEQGETLYTPSNLVHKVECFPNISSVHLNFALNLRHTNELYSYFFRKINEKIDSKYDLSLPLSKKNISSISHIFQSTISSTDFKSLQQAYERDQFMESMRLMKEGRKYQ